MKKEIGYNDRAMPPEPSTIEIRPETLEALKSAIKDGVLKSYDQAIELGIGVRRGIRYLNPAVTEDDCSRTNLANGY